MSHDKITISFVGDINFGNGLPLNPYKDIEPIISKADIFVGNLEGPLIDTGYKPLKSIACHSREQNIKNLTIANTNIYSLANNHITDYGKDGLKNTIDKLLDNNICYFGAGVNLSKAIKPVIINHDNFKIGFIGFGWNVIDCVYAKKNKYGVAPLNSKNIIDSIKILKNNVDYVVVSLHFGYERESIPLPSQRNLCHSLINNGADLIIGHHTHIIQGIEKYKGKIIVYGLGNFLFSSLRINNKTVNWEEEARKSFIFQLLINKNKKIEYKIHPIFFDYKLNVHLFDNHSRKGLINEISNLSVGLDLDEFAYYQYWKNNRKRNLVNPSNSYTLTKTINNLIKIKSKILKLYF